MDKDMIAEVEKAKLLAGQYQYTRDKARLLKAYISVYDLSLGLDMFVADYPVYWKYIRKDGIKMNGITRIVTKYIDGNKLVLQITTNTPDYETFPRYYHLPNDENIQYELKMVQVILNELYVIYQRI